MTCRTGPGAHVKPGNAVSAARPWPSVKQPTVHTDRSRAQIPSAMRPWTPRHSGLQRHKVTHAGTEKNGPPAARIRSQRAVFADGGRCWVRTNAIGPKPEIVLDDAVNNDLRIVRNEENCLIYDRPLAGHGLLWSELADWWADRDRTEADEGPIILQVVGVSLDRVRRPADVSQVSQEPVDRDDGARRRPPEPSTIASPIRGSPPDARASSPP
jgi:hypothetical protein